MQRNTRAIKFNPHYVTPDGRLRDVTTFAKDWLKGTSPQAPPLPPPTVPRHRGTILDVPTPEIPIPKPLPAGPFGYGTSPQAPPKPPTRPLVLTPSFPSTQFGAPRPAAGGYGTGPHAGPVPELPPAKPIKIPIDVPTPPVPKGPPSPFGFGYGTGPQAGPPQLPDPPKPPPKPAPKPGDIPDIGVPPDIPGPTTPPTPEGRPLPGPGFAVQRTAVMRPQGAAMQRTAVMRPGGGMGARMGGARMGGGRMGGARMGARSGGGGGGRTMSVRNPAKFTCAQGTLHCEPAGGTSEFCYCQGCSWHPPSASFPGVPGHMDCWKRPPTVEPTPGAPGPGTQVLPQPRQATLAQPRQTTVVRQSAAMARSGGSGGRTMAVRNPFTCSSKYPGSKGTLVCTPIEGTTAMHCVCRICAPEYGKGGIMCWKAPVTVEPTPAAPLPGTQVIPRPRQATFVQPRQATAVPVRNPKFTCPTQGKLVCTPAGGTAEHCVCHICATWGPNPWAGTPGGWGCWDIPPTVEPTPGAPRPGTQVLPRPRQATLVQPRQATAATPSRRRR